MVAWILSVRSREGLFRQVVVMCLPLGDIRLPTLSIPQFQMVANSHQNDLLVQGREFRQFGGDANSSLTIQRDALCL